MKARPKAMSKREISKYPKQFIIEFLALYKSLPELWKIKTEAYFDRVKKERAYALIIDKLQEVESFPNREMAISLFSALRLAYRQQLKKMQQGQRPTLWFYEHINFLQEQMFINRNIINFNEIQDNSAPSESTVETTNDEEHPHSSPDSNHENDEAEVSTLITVSPVPVVSLSSSIESLSDQPTNLDYPASTSFAESTEFENERNPNLNYNELKKSWASILRTASREQEVIATKLINDIIYEASMENLNANSPVEISNILHEQA